MLREALGLAAPGVLALSLLLAVSAVARPSAETSGVTPTDEPPRLCGNAHVSRGESSPADLEGVAKAYALLKTQLTFSVQASRFDPEKALDCPFDLGLPACRGRGSRRVALKDAVPPSYRNSRLYFMRWGSRTPPSLPEAVRQNPETEILIVSVPRMRDLAELSRALGRRVTPAPAKLAQLLGLHCANTWVSFSENGDEALLAEGD
jgi:hypothetical protein